MTAPTRFNNQPVTLSDARRAERRVYPRTQGTLCLLRRRFFTLVALGFRMTSAAHLVGHAKCRYS